MLNHALFKGLLFLGAGAVAHATGTRDLDRLGGLGKRMPWTGATFLVGAAAISGLPPLNGFVSEFLIYTGAFAAALAGRGALLAAAVAVAAGLALIGGLALACFTKAFGVVFLGEPRSPRAGRAGEVAAALRLPMAALAAACAAIGLAAPWVLAGMARTLGQVAQAFGLPSPDAQIETLRGALAWVSLGALALLAAVALAVLARRLLLRGRTVTAAPTWGCGYAAPSPRMQYTASSFAQPLVDLFRPVLRTEATGTLPSGAFPGARIVCLRDARPRRTAPVPPAVRRRRGALRSPALAAAGSHPALPALPRRHAARPPAVEGEVGVDSAPVLRYALAFALAPLLGGVIARTKAFVAGRTGAPLLQGYFDLAKLLRKGAVYSTTTSWVFRAGPVVTSAPWPSRWRSCRWAGPRRRSPFPGISSCSPTSSAWRASSPSSRRSTPGRRSRGWGPAARRSSPRWPSRRSCSASWPWPATRATSRSRRA